MPRICIGCSRLAPYSPFRSICVEEDVSLHAYRTQKQTVVDKNKDRFLLLNVGLDLGRLEGTTVTSGLNYLRNELGMLDRLATLHDAHNRRLGLVVSVGRDSFVGRLVLLLGLLQLDLVDLDAHLGVGEAGIIGEDVGCLYLLALWCFRQDAIFGACEGLQRSLQFRVR